MDSALKAMSISIRHFLSFLFLLPGFASLFSCSQSDTCLEPQSLAMRGRFYYVDTANTKKDTALVNAFLRFGNNYSYYLQLIKSNTFSFPLAQNQDSVSIIYQSDSSSVLPSTLDTIILKYARDVRFISTACGYRTFFTLNEAKTTTNTIDSVIIKTALIDNDVNKEHLQLVIKK
jgi:hypothetical protein